MPRSPSGVCHICGRQGPLSFEHIPPKAAFNNRPLILSKYEDWERGQGSEYLKEGRGAHTLCVRCNNTTGGDYGPAYVEWVYQGVQLVHHTMGKASQNYHGVIHPLRVIKQIATIFFSVNSDQFRKANPDLEQFVLDRNRKGLSPRYRFFVFWYGGGELRQSGVTGAMDLEKGRINTLSEFVHPPFGYVMSLGGTPFDRRPEEISDFTQFDYDEAITLNRRFPVLPTHWMMPGDYRTLEQIARDVEINEAAARGSQDPEADADAVLRSREQRF